jgi:hypothetical protein
VFYLEPKSVLPGTQKCSTWNQKVFYLEPKSVLPGTKKCSTWNQKVFYLEPKSALPGTKKCSTWNQKVFYLEPKSVLPGTKKGSTWNQKVFSCGDTRKTLLEPFFPRVRCSKTSQSDELKAQSLGCSLRLSENTRDRESKSWRY